jgi:dTDP-4-amino-4,6-dideoxygalactose transaminase
LGFPVPTNELAIYGGSSVRQRPLPGWPRFDNAEISAAKRVLASGRVNCWTGEEVERFEHRFAEACSVAHAVAVSNGTVALELALRALGIGPGDEVVVTPRTFIASVSSIVLCGATPIFADVDRTSQNFTPESVAAVLSPRTRAILAVHHAGWPCDMDGLQKLTRERGLKLVEDCAQAAGARFRGQPVGSFGDVAAFSFCQDKIITTAGEGGMLVTDDPELWERAWSYKDHGKAPATMEVREDSSAFRWVHESLGTNWRLTEVQAAVGSAQLEKLGTWVDARRRNAETLTARLEEDPVIRVTRPPAHIRHAYYKYYAFLDPDRLRSGWDRDRVVTAIRAEGIPCLSGGCPEVYLEPAFDGTGLRPEQRLPVARELGETSLMFVVHPTLEEKDVEDTARAVRKVLAAARA